MEKIFCEVTAILQKKFIDIPNFFVQNVIPDTCAALVYEESKGSDSNKHALVAVITETKEEFYLLPLELIDPADLITIILPEPNLKPPRNNVLFAYKTSKIENPKDRVYVWSHPTQPNVRSLIGDVKSQSVDIKTWNDKSLSDGASEVAIGVKIQETDSKITIR